MSNSPEPQASQPAPAIFADNLEWRLSRMGKTHKLRLVQSGDTFTGSYVGLNNDSRFDGAIAQSGSAISITFTQSSPTKPYRATQSGRLTQPNVISGEWQDNRGNHGQFLLRGRVVAQSPTGQPAREAANWI